MSHWLIDVGPRAFRSLLFMPAYRRLFIVAAAVVTPAVCAAGPKPDVENGKATFTAMCGVCHSVVKTGGPTQGPNLLGVVGRKAASEPEFVYTPALKASGITVGCSQSPPLFCPDRPLTRKEMAVFLSVGFGLHWPD